MRPDWEAVIGLEIHVQLSTVSKIFSGASTTFGAEPNSQACPVDLGLPGVLPVVNDAVYPKPLLSAWVLVPVSVPAQFLIEKTISILTCLKAIRSPRWMSQLYLVAPLKLH